jgi:hypothetical protein
MKGLIERNKASQCPLKFIATGQSPPTFGNPLIFGFAFRVVRIVGAGFRVAALRKHSATSSLAF